MRARVQLPRSSLADGKATGGETGSKRTTRVAEEGVACAEQCFHPAISMAREEGNRDGRSGKAKTSGSMETGSTREIFLPKTVWSNRRSIDHIDCLVASRREHVSRRRPSCQHESSSSRRRRATATTTALVLLPLPLLLLRQSNDHVKRELIERRKIFTILAHESRGERALDVLQSSSAAPSQHQGRVARGRRSSRDEGQER